MYKSGRISLFIICTFFILSIFSPILHLQDPYEIKLDSLNMSPDINHFFGTDNKGRDIFSRVIYGAKFSIGITIVSAVISAIIGLSVGIISGYFGGRIDNVLMSLVDFVLSFPSLLLAIAISIVLPSGVYTVMIALAAVNWTSFARLIRGHVMTIRGMAFIDAARAIGCGNLRILIRHIAPQCVTLSLVMMGIKLGGLILTEAALSFLGLGVQPPTPTWGYMVSANRAYILTSPWMVIFPGAAISITALCFNIIGENLSKKYEIN
ncbi:MAG: ABC transporter permease [Nitrospirae bacterium]|nr:ABC transporter permease [Nitrospirota bacterium]